MSLSVSVIVPVYNGGSKFEKCLKALTTTRPAPFEIIVVPDGESDGPWRSISHHLVRALSPGTSARGPAAARNRGVHHALGDILFFVDADVVVPPGAIGDIQETFLADEQVDALIGSYDDAPDAPGFLSQYRNLLHHYVHQTSDHDASTFWGACGAVRRDVFLHSGGFDESYRNPSIEDIELGYRLKDMGRTIRLVKKLQVKHLKTWRVGSMLRTDLFCRAVPWTELIFRARTIRNDLNLRTESRFSIAFAYTFVVALAMTLWWPSAIFATIASLMILFIINSRLYFFFHRKRGWFFTLCCLPWHVLYFLYSGLGFLIGITLFFLRREQTFPTTGAGVKHRSQAFVRELKYPPRRFHR